MSGCVLFNRIQKKQRYDLKGGKSIQVYQHQLKVNSKFKYIL